MPRTGNPLREPRQGGIYRQAALHYSQPNWRYLRAGQLFTRDEILEYQHLFGGHPGQSFTQDEMILALLFADCAQATGDIGPCKDL